MKKKSVNPPVSAELNRAPRLLLRTALIMAVYLLAFVVLDILTKQLEEVPGVVAWYPPSGLTYTLLLVFGVEFAPAVMVALFISSLFVYRMPQPTYLLFLWAVIISLIYSAAAVFLRKRIRFDWHLRKLQDVIWFVLTAVLVSALLAILSVSSSALSSNMPRSEVLRAMFDWWIGETVGVLTVTPFLLLFVMPSLKRFTEGQPFSLQRDWSFQRPSLTTIGQAFSIVLALYLVFGVHLLEQFQPLYLISLPLIWVALSRGLKGISVAILALNSGVVVALWLVRFDPAALDALELLMIVNCMVGLLLGAVVNERKQAEVSLQESEERYRQLIEFSPDAVVVHSGGEFVYMNSAALTLYGATDFRKLLGTPMLDRVHPDFRKVVEERIRRLSEGGKADLLEETFLRLDGSEIDVDVSAIQIIYGGKPAIQMVIRDTSRRKKAEEELRLSEEKYRTLVDEVNDGYYMSDAAGVFTFANPAMARIYGVESPDALVGRKFSDFLASEVPGGLNEVYSTSMQTGSTPEVINGQIRRPDGTRIFIEVKPTMILKAEKIVGTRGVVRDITERKQREEEIQSRTDELTALYQLSRSLGDANELENVIGLINRQAVESVQTTFACIALVEAGDLVPRAVYPIRNMEHNFIMGDRQPISALPFCQHVLDKNEPVILQTSNPDVSSLERATLMCDFAQVVCLVPLWAGDDLQRINQALGLLILGEARQEKREPFTPEKIRLARSIGDQAAAAIRRLLLHEHADRRLQHLSSISEIDRAIASSFDLRLSLQMILKHVMEQLEVDAADVLVFNARMQALEFTAGRGFRSTAIERTRLRLGEGQAGQAALKRLIIQIPDVATSGAIFARPERLEKENIVAYFAVPLITKGKVKGVLEIFQRSPLAPNVEWLDFLNTLAGQAAIAVDNVQMFDSLQRSTDELELAYDATIEGWSRAMDLRDKETEGHTLRVTDTTIKLARTFGLSEAELVQVRWGALLHDIGKMGVPDGILLKAGPLTDEEWVAMKKHPTFAYEMLSPIHYLHAALDIPYCHHEWWDGTGYPRGLKGEQIPLAARIFAVVDVWDALTSDRPYRKAWPEDQARQHIEAESGTHFDPQVVKTFFVEEK